METIWTEPYWWYRFTTWIYKKARTSLTAIQWQIKRFHQALQCSCFITRLVMMSIGHLKIPTPEFCSFRFPLGTNVNMQWDTWILHFLKKTRQAYICIYYNYIIDHLQGIWLRFLVVFSHCLVVPQVPSSQFSDTGNILSKFRFQKSLNQWVDSPHDSLRMDQPLKRQTEVPVMTCGMDWKVQHTWVIDGWSFPLNQWRRLNLWRD